MNDSNNCNNNCSDGNKLRSLVVRDADECVKQNVLNDDFLNCLLGWVGITPERAFEIFEIVKKAGITEFGNKSSIKAILDVGDDKETDEVEKVFAGFLIAWREYWNTEKNVILEDINVDKIECKPVVRQTKRQGGTIYIKLNDFAKIDTFYAVSNIGDNTIILREIEMKYA